MEAASQPLDQRRVCGVADWIPSRVEPGRQIETNRGSHPRDLLDAQRPHHTALDAARLGSRNAGSPCDLAQAEIGVEARGAETSTELDPYRLSPLRCKILGPRSCRHRGSMSIRPSLAMHGFDLSSHERNSQRA